MIKNIAESIKSAYSFILTYHSTKIVHYKMNNALNYPVL